LLLARARLYLSKLTVCRLSQQDFLESVRVAFAPAEMTGQVLIELL
jgi:hypothetical protein